MHDVRRLDETEFHVRSYLRAGDPVAPLTSLAHQTPFLFERRPEWFERYTRQVSFSRGLRGLISSKIEFFRSSHTRSRLYGACCKIRSFGTCLPTRSAWVRRSRPA